VSLYLTLSQGPRADRAEPILATSDPRVIDAMLNAVRRLGQRPDLDATGRGGMEWEPRYRQGYQDGWVDAIHRAQQFIDEDGISFDAALDRCFDHWCGPLCEWGKHPERFRDAEPPVAPSGRDHVA